MASLLGLPAELRSQIYDLIFVETCPYTSSSSSTAPPSEQPSLARFGRPSALDETRPAEPPPLLLTCRQIHHETQRLYFRRTSFVVSGPDADRERFFRLCTSTLSRPLLSDISHVTLVGNILHLYNINTTWNAIPFGNPFLRLKTLVIVPRRPATHGSHYAVLADSGSAHTLAYILSEALKSLGRVERVIVRNDDQCFDRKGWRVVYRTMVDRLFRWGGKLCCSRFRWDHQDESWFEVLLDGRSADASVWKNAAQESQRLERLMD